mgnify:CR=1 FL=1
MTVGALSGTGAAVYTWDPGRAGVFSFDAAVVSSIDLNAPHSGDGSVTVSGLGFGQVTYTATAALGSAPCSTSSWTSGTSVACQGMNKLDEISTAEMTVAGVVGTGHGVFSFDAPAASFVAANAVMSGYGSVTVSGLSFRYVEYTATAQLVSAVCETASWSSGSSVRCMASSLWDAEASLYDAMRTVQVSVGGVVGTQTEGFSFDAPAVSFVGSNAAVSGRGSVTVSGLSFGLAEHTATAAVGSEPCVTVSWSSLTSLACLGLPMRSAGGQLMSTLEVTVSGFVGTGLELFSFDAPAASDALRNAPLTGDGSVTVAGLSFGVREYTATAALGSAACTTSSWSSGT